MTHLALAFARLPEKLGEHHCAWLMIGFQA
jgi:hypothetical protein